MSGLIVAAVLFLSQNVFAGNEDRTITIPFDSVSGKYAYSKVVETAGANAATLYTRSKNWSKQKYSDDKFLIDETDSKLIDLGSFSINVLMKGGMVKAPFVYTVTYIITTQFKDGKSKLEITNMKLTQNAQGNTEEQALESFQKQMESLGMGKNIAKGFVLDVCKEIDTNMQKIITEVETALKTEALKSDW